MKNLFGTQIVETFRFRTCVDPKIKEESGGIEIIYESLTAQEIFQSLIQSNPFCLAVKCVKETYSMSHIETGFEILTKFVKSDEGLPCVNTVEKAYLSLLVIVFALGIISLFRLSHFKVELRKIFDPRQWFTVSMDHGPWYYVINIRHH